MRQENADRAALTALIAEKQAVGWANQASTSARRAELERKPAELKARKTAHGLR